MKNRNEIVGKRIKEFLQIRKMSQIQLCREIDEMRSEAGNPTKMDPAHMNKYIKGKLHVPETTLDEISKVLRIPSGYLQMDDIDDINGFQCETFNQFREFKMLEKNTDFTKYRELLNLAGFKLFAYVDSYIDNIPNSYGYILSMMDDSKNNLTLTDTEMESYYDSLLQSLRTNAIELLSDYDPTNSFITDKMAGRPTTQQRKGEKKNERKNE